MAVGRCRSAGAALGPRAALSPRQALRRALLEAAQSRVVALQGSREDLYRHATDWLETHEAAERGFNDMRARAEAVGRTPPPPEPEPPGSVHGQLTQMLGRL